MKKKGIVLILTVCMLSLFSVPASAAPSVDAFIGLDLHNGCDDPYGYVRGKAYAYSTHNNLDHINVYGEFRAGSSSGTLLESGVESGGAFEEVAFFTKKCTYDSSNHYYQKATAREYYQDGTSSPQYTASDTW